MPYFFQPTFFDIFGFLGFVFITIIAILSLLKKEKLPCWTYIILLMVGVLGLIVDAYFVLTTYFL